ncbi:hypothetical protein BAE44_0000210 [Dichanthelium oligosanthes]|uniref:Bifunctional inhibitor/plant lipid transfer protein/seed storage helical domain-containing protein n=1 Tax=Dichanthelium oligosanthes TaxID=888268 RepID=A0A1E5WN10_9POAL|nr:hypothetical protein BAE44_0000210 [Dichanthelium oligosanthes]
MPGKIVLLLVVFAIISPHQVMAECTREQKEAILVDCRKYLSRNARTIVAPKTWSHCCRNVRVVPNKDMECIKRLRTTRDRMRFVETRIMNLAHLC